MSHSGMVVPVMSVRKVRVAVSERCVCVNMVMRLLLILRVDMVLMVRIMAVPMTMLQGLVLVRVGMPFRQVQPDAGGH